MAVSFSLAPTLTEPTTQHNDRPPTTQQQVRKEAAGSGGRCEGEAGCCRGGEVGKALLGRRL